MDKLDLVNQIEMLEQYGADQTVKIAACDESEFFCMYRHHCPRVVDDTEYAIEDARLDWLFCVYWRKTHCSHFLGECLRVLVMTVNTLVHKKNLNDRIR
jgi:hypothetical protein